MQSTNETTLVLLAQKGNTNAAGQLYEMHHPGIFQYLFYRVGDVHTAEELTGEVFLKMVRALPGYRSTNGTFRSWLYTIARNMAIDHYRRASNRPQATFDDELGLTLSRVRGHANQDRFKSLLESRNDGFKRPPHDSFGIIEWQHQNRFHINTTPP